MDEIVAGCVQVKMGLPHRPEEVEENLLRFVRVAQTKRVRLLVFPLLTGMMATAPVLTGRHATLLKEADRSRRANLPLWERTRSRLASGVAGMLKADFGRSLVQALQQDPEGIWATYVTLFRRLARYSGMTIVAGSAYVVDPADGALRHMSLVFGPDGELLGQQAVVSLAPSEAGFVEPGTHWQVIPTPVGRLGLLLGRDMLYPEPGRLLAYAGAEVMVGLAASGEEALYQRQRSGLLARVEENQVYGVMSFAVGANPFTPVKASQRDASAFVGRSLLAAPISMTPRHNGVLVEMGTDSTEGLLTAEWDFPALQRLWVEDEPAVRRTMPVPQAGRLLAAVYASGLTIDEATRMAAMQPPLPGLLEPGDQAAELDGPGDEAVSPGDLEEEIDSLGGVLAQ